MATQNKSNGDSGLHTTPFQPQADEISVRHIPSHEEIKHRAYEIHLERGGLPGHELDDWLRAERELQKVALFTLAWNRLQQRRSPTPKPEIGIRRMERMETGNP